MSSRESRADSLASPCRARSLLTVRAAISSAVSSDFPSSRRESLMCSYCRARLVPFFTPRGGTSSLLPSIRGRCSGPSGQRPSCSSRSSSASSPSRSSASFASSTASRALSLSFPQPSCASPSSCFVLPSTRSLSMFSPSRMVVAVELPVRCGFDTSAYRSGDGARELEILGQLGATLPAFVACPQHRRGMERHDDGHRELGHVEDAAAERRHPRRPVDQRLGGDPPEADEHVGPDERQLCLQPRAAGPDLRPVRRVVDPARPLRSPLEVLDRVRQVDVLVAQTDLAEDLAQKRAGRSHERLAAAVLDVARLPADEHDAGRDGTLTEDDARRTAPQLAAAARLRLTALVVEPLLGM